MEPSMCNRLSPFLRLFFGVELSVVLYTFGYGLYAPASQAFIYRKICLYHYDSDTICNYIDTSPDLAEKEKVVQADYATYYTILTVSNSIPALFMTLVMGTWVDRFSFKLPLTLPHLGSAAFTLTLVIFAYLPNHLINPIYLGIFSALSGLTGSMSTVLSACATYVSQTTSGHNRTVRLANIEASLTIGGTLGFFINAFGFAHLSPSHAFIVQIAIHVYAVVYVFVVIPELHDFETVKEKVMTEAGGSWLAFIFKPRKDFLAVFRIFYGKSAEFVKYNHIRVYLLFLVFVFSVTSLTTGNSGIIYDFLTSYPISFTSFDYAMYNAVYGVSVSFALMCGMRLLKKFFNFSDAAFLVAGTVSRIISFTIFAFGQLFPLYAPWLYCVCTMFAFYPFVAIRSGFSKLIDKEEQGRMLSLLALLENAFGLLGSVVLNSLYVALLSPSFSSNVATAVTRGYAFLFSAEIFACLLILCIWLGNQKIPNWSFHASQ